MEARTSNPTKNKNRTRPIVDTKLR
jgi:hypothetical protein